MCETQENERNNTVKACDCKISRQCLIGADCECLQYCSNNLPLYQKINGQGNNKICWLTFSPKPRSEAMRQFGACDYDRFKEFHKDFFKKNKYINDYILVSELNKKGQLHYHALFSFKSKVSIIKTMIQPLFYMGNVEPIYNSLPKMGIHYLFKDTKAMIEYYDGETPYFMSNYHNTTIEV